ncbi:hypothetical protein BLOT_009158 [Blomia tropicalis]|nr:hypothetical protein BLOT_009158 [Blomia tropicalis]
MARKTKLYITDEELDRQSFPPPSYVDVYPNGPPKRFSQFSNVDLTLSTTIIKQPHSSVYNNNDNYMAPPLSLKVYEKLVDIYKTNPK